MFEKRVFPRFKKACAASLKIKGSDSVFSGQTIDISRSGVALKIKKALPNSSTASLHITPSPEHPSITAEAQSIWNKPISSNGYFYYGLRFTELEEDSSLTLRRLLGYEVDHIVTASYLPEQVVTNEDIVKMGFKGSAASLERGLGAKERRAAAPDETAASMHVKVANKILNKAGILAQEIDRILCSTEPQDAGAPDTATRVQTLLGATCPAYGFSMSCVGWHAAIDTALRCLESGERHILVLATSCVGSWLYFHNPMHRAIFGDAAGGILLEKQHRKKFLASRLWTDGSYYHKIFVPYNWTKHPKNIPSEYQGSFYMSSDQKIFFGAIDKYLVSCINQLLQQAKHKKEDIDLFLLHYASKPLFEYSLEVLDVPRSKVFENFKYYGNIIAAEMPLLLDEAIEKDRIKDGDLVLAFTYGAGISIGGFIIRY